ncbi:hypothetical protein [Mycoplasma todarodis]|uniref:Uncharacterized protein n=1 Tax=Mycoplasma todarodis TaxID=1937191 RepID=A0A4V2NID1_9MOLU|nr:hypothetical protein [Mycoplasma todarodis]TCG11822.1 hypothetical protein C4B25_00695 [Mycoplasma todarodis]
MLILLIISTLLMPLMVSLLWDKQHIISVYIVSFISMFLFINVTNSFTINIKLITTIFSLGYITLYSFLIYKSIKLKKFNIQNLVKTLKWIAPLYMSMAIIFFIRMWFTRMNTDALAYAETSNFIKRNSNDNTDPVYNLPSFYSFAAMFPRPVDVFSIGGDVIVISIFSTAIFKIMDDARKEQGLFSLVVIMIISITFALSLPFVTSSVNWVIVSLVTIILVAMRKNTKMFLLAPLAFGIFSFSSLLLAPISLVYVFMKRRFTLKEFIDSIIISIMVTVVFVMTLANMSEKLMIIPLIMSPLFFLSYTPIIKDSEHDGFLLKVNKIIFKGKERKELYKVTKKFKLISSLVLTAIGLLLMIAIAYKFDRTSSIQGIITKMVVDPYLWGVPMVMWMILDALWKKELTSWIKIGLAFVVICAAYYVLIKISPRVPRYILLRTVDPAASIVLVLFSLFLYETYPAEKFTWKSLALIPMVITFPAITVFHKSEPRYFSTNPSTSVAQNYKWVKNNEWKTLEKYKDKKVYSDVPAFIMGINGKDNHSLMNASQHRELFHGDLFVTMLGRKWYVEQNFDSIQNNIENDGIYKWTIEYAKIYEKKTNGASWNNIDKAEVYAFRHKEYAEDILKHFGWNKKDHLKIENGMYIIER